MIDHEEFLCYGGKLSREERIAAQPSRRARRCPRRSLLTTFGANGTATEKAKLHNIMRAVTYGGQVRDILKATWVGSLALRQFNVDGRSLQVANTTLEEALRARGDLGQALGQHEPLARGAL